MKDKSKKRWRGSIEELPSGHWSARARGTDVQGKRYEIIVTCATRDAAERALASALLKREVSR